MEQRKENCYEELRKRIENENTPRRRRMFFSVETKKRIEQQLGSGISLTILSEKIGVPTNTLSKWHCKKKREMARPKKLTVVANFEKQQSLHSAVATCTDVQFPNGIVIKGIAFNAKNLALLKGL